MATARITPHCRSTSTLHKPPYFINLDKQQEYHQRTIEPAAAVLSSLAHVNSASYGALSSGNQQKLGPGAGKKKAREDSTLDVFSAEKYFNGTMDGSGSPLAFQQDLSPRQLTVKGKGGGLSQHGSPYRKAGGTPSVCSDLSANSQSSLLWAPPKNRRPQPGSPRRPAGKKLLDSLLRCNSCSKANSVDAVSHSRVMKTDSVPKKDTARHDAIGSTASVSSKSSVSPTAAMEQLRREVLLARGAGGVDSRRQSREDFVRAALQLDLDDCRLPKGQDKPAASSTPSVMSGVFGSPIDEMKRHSVDVHQKQMEKLSLDADDDTRSETSSELFEIESISNIVPRGTPISSVLSVTTPSCYEPSEGSVDWSVVTASAANDCTDLWGSEFPEYATGTKKSVKQNHNRPPSLFMGCASTRAVSVSNNAYHKVPVERKGDAAYGSVSPRRPVPKHVPSVENRLTETFKTAQVGRTWIVQPISPPHGKPTECGY